VLGKDYVNRRGPGKKGKRGDSLSRSMGVERLYRRYDGSDVMQCHGRLGYICAYVRCNTERAVRMGEIPLRMDVNNLDRPASNDQRDAQQGDEKSPRGTNLRFWA